MEIEEGRSSHILSTETEAEDVTQGQIDNLKSALKSLNIDFDIFAKVLGKHAKADSREERILVFENELRKARLAGKSWYEATPEMMNYVAPEGVDPEKGYKIWMDVRVCLPGVMERNLKDDFKISPLSRLHGGKAVLERS